MSRTAVLLLLLAAAPLAADVVRVTDRNPEGRVVRTEDFSDGAPLWEVTYDPASGRPLRETAFRDGEAAESADLVWTGAVLTGRTVRGPDGGLLFGETLYRWPDGRLRRVERTGGDGSAADTAWTYGADGALSGAWTTEGGERHREWNFADNRVEQRLFEGPDEVLRRLTEWQAEGRSVQTTEVPPGGRTTVVAADGRGRPLTEKVSLKDQTLSLRTWTYDAAGRPASLETTLAGRSDRREFQYPDNDTEVTRWSRAGLVYKEETRRAGDLTQVRYFDRGRHFLTETYQDGRLVLETYYKDGAAVRERRR